MPEDILLAQLGAVPPLAARQLLARMALEGWIARREAPALPRSRPSFLMGGGVGVRLHGIGAAGASGIAAASGAPVIAISTAAASGGGVSVRGGGGLAVHYFALLERCLAVRHTELATPGVRAAP